MDQDDARAAIIWTRSRELNLNVRYHRTHRMMTSRSKCRPLKSSCAEAGSVIPGVTAGYRPFQAFAPEPLQVEGAADQDILAYHKIGLSELRRIAPTFVGSHHLLEMTA